MAMDRSFLVRSAELTAEASKPESEKFVDQPMNPELFDRIFG